MILKGEEPHWLATKQKPDRMRSLKKPRRLFMIIGKWWQVDQQETRKT